MAIEHDTDPNLPRESGTDPNYPATLGDRPSFGKLNYGPQMRAETDPNFLTPPASKAEGAITEAGPMSDDPISSGPDSRGARRARHAAKAHKPRPGQNDTVKMLDAVQVNETVPLPDSMVAPEVIARRAPKAMRRDQMTELNDSGKAKVERKLLSAAIYGILAAALVIAISEFLLK